MWFDIAKQVAAAVLDLIKAAVTEGKTDAQALRDKPITVSVSFAGGDGEVVKVQREIYADLPDEPAGDAPTDPGSTPDPA